MKKLTLATLLGLLIIVKIHSQSNTFFIGDKTYPSTISYTLYSGSGTMFSSNSLKFFFVRDEKKGMIVFKSSLRIKGTVIIYLDDNSTIKLVDRNTYDLVNNEYMVIYNLTESEISKLKVENINTIRFQYDSMYDEGAKTVENTERKQRNYISKELETIPRVNFPDIINEFYN